jgi:hypothetical protein
VWRTYHSYWDICPTRPPLLKDSPCAVFGLKNCANGLIFFLDFATLRFLVGPPYDLSVTWPLAGIQNSRINARFGHKSIDFFKKFGTRGCALGVGIYPAEGGDLRRMSGGNTPLLAMVSSDTLNITPVILLRHCTSVLTGMRTEARTLENFIGPG